ncbi:MAG: succinylglutamate desuccinylase/aspartoacylase family protein [Firmicutes bacterium]|jgi:hypothetical protein|nr:succinylglutamate desuccinylase/aspartoacylase family protein [Bacillota bacterium]
MRRSAFCTTALGLLLVLSLTVGAGAADRLGVGNLPAPVTHDVRPGYGATAIKWLSAYHPAIAHTPVDTAVYYLEGKKPGPTLLILGGTHGNEIAGVMAATLIVERAVVESGRVIVVPRANNSASSIPDTLRPGIQWFSIETASGVRTFRYGDRRTSLEHQGPDPATYVHEWSGGEMAGNESRNLNRVHPGKPDGSLTEQLAYAFSQLIEVEKVNIAIDLHEAGVTSRLANMIVANPKNLDIAALAVVDMEMAGMPMNVDQSAPTSWGLSHREWGDRTDVLAFLIETPNPGQEQNIVDPDVVNDPENPLSKRVAIHLTGIEAILNSVELMRGSRPVWTGLPAPGDLIRDGLGTWLR